MRFAILLFLALVNTLFAQDHEMLGQDKKAVKIAAVNFENLHQLNAEIYRCEQPTKAGMQELEKMGIKTVLNLRNRLNDKKEAKGTAITIVHWPINTWKMAYADVLQALRLIYVAEKPIAVHCLHGSDRTGVVIAAYRMAVEDWSKEAAIAEFKAEQFGYHEGWFPRLLVLLENIDVRQLKEDFSSLKNKK